MGRIIRDVSNEDLDEVLSLNQSEVPHVGSVNLDRMRWFARHAHYFRVVLVDDSLAAFLVGLRPGTTYDSPNYAWFCERYDDFIYVDRVAVAPFARRLGLARQLYDDFATVTPAATMTCEVNILPPNELSMRFHERLGFREVGTLASSGGSKKVAMLLKELSDD